MKFLEVYEFDQLTSSLNKELNGIRIESVLEAYSCKPGSDRKLYKSMDNMYAELATSPSHCESIASSPFGPLSDTSSRKTFIFLVATLNAIFPDYDFSNAKPEEFRDETNLYLVCNSINSPLQSTLPHFPGQLQEELWSTLDREIMLKDCLVYSFFPDPDSDPFYQDGRIWGFNYFFYNKKMKRMVFFHCRATRKTAISESQQYFQGGSSSSSSSNMNMEDDDEGYGWGDDPDTEFMMDM